jgi:neurofibromin 1
VHLALEGASLSPALSALLGGNRGGVGLSGIARQRVLQQFRALREATTGAMSNLLGANVEVGLSHAIGMGYHFDAGVRLAFTEVLNKVLHQGAEFETLASTVLSDRYGKLVDLVISPDLHIVNAMSRSTSSEEQDELCKVLVPIFDAENALLPLCARLAAGEARATRAVETLFRGNSLATKLSVATLRLHGQGYLQELLGDTLKSLMAEAGAVSYEVDPNKLDASAQPEEVRARNLANLSALVRRVFAAISNTPLPLPMRVLCLGIRLGIREAFPEAEISAVGALFFLRFVTPALVSPVAHGMLPADTKLPVPVIRALLLMSKVLQTVANQAEFSGVKEVYMQDLNGLVREILPEMHHFLDSVSTVTALDTRTINAFERYGVPLPASLRVIEGTSISRLSSTSAADGAEAGGASAAGGQLAKAAAKVAVEDGLTVSEAHAHALHRLLHIHLDKVGREMTALVTGSSSGADARAAARSRATGTFDRLTTLLAQLGEPPKATAENRHHSFAASVDDNKRLEDFLARHRFLATPTSAVEKQQLFFRAAAADGGKGGGPGGGAGSPLAGNGGRSLFCYIARRYNPSELDAEQVMFHVLQLLKPALSSGFDLLVDLTQFSPSNEPSGPTINKFIQLLPPTIVSHVNAVYLLHAPASFRPLAKRLSRQVVTSKFYKKLQFVSMNELAALAPAAAGALPSSTRRLVETMHEFEHVACVGDNKKSAPATVRVGPEAILVLPDERGKVLNHAVRLMDSFAVADMIDLVLPAESKDGLLHVTMRQGAVALAFGGAGVEGLGRALREVWKRHLLLKPTIDKQWKVMRPADVPGTLLNMALLNLGSSEPRLRQAAYNLLAAATTTFAFQIGGQLLEAHGLAIPENNSSFIIAISQALATRESRLTLEFLDECLTGLRSSTSEQKHLCLEYMQPWLKNLATFEDARVQPVLEGLVAITLRERELYPSLQAKVWFPLGQQERLARLAIGLFVETAAGHGHTSREAATMADAAVTLASANATLVAGVIFEEVLSLLRNSAKSSQPQLEDHACWPRLMTLTRFLVTLSFNNRLDVERYAPEALYTVTMLLGSGSAWTRAAMHAVTVNLTQALCTTLPLTEGQRKGLRLLLEEMVQSKFCLQFGLTGKAAASAELVFRSGGSNLQTQGGAASGAGAGGGAGGGEKSVFGRDSLAPVSMGALQAVAEMLWEVVLLSEPADAAWRERWRVLVTASAFRRNPALQPRAFVVLGIVLESIDPNEEPPLVPRALVALAAALRRHDAALADSILLCLARVLRVAPPPQADADGVSYHLAVFWASVAVLQLREQRLFASALAAMEAALQALELAGHFRGRHVVDVVGSCLSLAQEQFTKLEDHCGLSFSRSFDFALGASLLRGFDHSSPSTVSRTSRVLATLLGLERQVAPSAASETPASLDASPGGSSSSLLAMAREAELSTRERNDSRRSSGGLRDTPRISALSRRRAGTAKGAASRGGVVAEDKVEADAALAAALEAATVTPHMLGFLAAILPMADEVRQALETQSTRHKYAAMLRPPTLAGEEEAALLVVMMVAKLQRCRRETDRAFLFEFLAEAAEVQPGVFNLVDATLVPLVLEAVTRVPNPDIVESCQRLLRTLLRANLESAGSQLTDLGRLGFGKLASAASFDEKPDSDEGYTIAGAVLDALVPHLVAGKAAAHDISPIMQALREEEVEEEEVVMAAGDGPGVGAAQEQHDEPVTVTTPAPARTPPRRPSPTEAAVLPAEDAALAPTPAARVGVTEQSVGTGPATVAAQRLRAQGVLQKPPSGKPPPPPVSPRVRRTTMDPKSGPLPPRRSPRPQSLLLQGVGGANNAKGAEEMEGADERTSSFA